MLWDLHDEQEQCEAFQQACCTSSPLGLQKVSPVSPPGAPSMFFSPRGESVFSSRGAPPSFPSIHTSLDHLDYS